MGCRARRRHCSQPVYYTNCAPVNYSNCTPIRNNSNNGNDSFIQRNAKVDNLKISKPVDGQQGIYDKVITFDVKSGEIPKIIYSGLFKNGCKFVGWDGSLAGNNVGLNNDAVRIVKERKFDPKTSEARDFYSIGVKRDVKINFLIGENKINHDAPLTDMADTQNPPVNAVKPDIKVESTVANKELTPEEEIEKLKQEVAGAQEKSLSLEGKLSQSQLALRDSKYKQVHNSLSAMASDSNYPERNTLNEILQGLRSKGYTPQNLYKAAIKLKLYELTNPELSSEERKNVNSLVGTMREHARAAKKSVESPGRITKFEVEESGNNYDYEVSGTSQNFKVKITEGPWFKDSATQKRLNYLMKNAKTWEDFDKALDYITTQKLSVAFED